MSTPASTRVSGRHYQSRRVVNVEISDGRIVNLRQVPPAEAMAQSWPWIAPGFIDVQINGYGGQEFSSLNLTAEKVVEIARRQTAFGVICFCPTVTTADFETLAHGVRTIAAACDRWPEVDRLCGGIHLEGPYIASEDGPRGAHPAAHCRPPDWDEFTRLQHAAQGRIKLVTLSAEYDQSAPFIRRAVQSGVVAAIGHTSANSLQIRAAVDAGATLSTHLGNGAHRLLRRHPNYLWDQLAEDRLMASLIVDGHHLPPEVVQSIVRAKTPDRCLLISDLSGLSGLPPGRYATQLCELEILDDGRLVIAGQDQLLAGASLPIGAGIANVMRFAGLDLATALRMAGHHPATLLRRPPNRLLPGDPADLVLFDLFDGPDGLPQRLAVRSTYVAGHCAYQADGVN